MAGIKLYILVPYVLIFIIKGMKFETNNAIMSNYQRLRENLSMNYDINARPVKYKTNVTNLYMYFYIDYILDVDEEKQTILIDGLMYLTWQDMHLVWDPKDYNGIYEINLPPSKLWKPDLFEIQTGTPSSAITQNNSTLIYVYYDGHVYWEVFTSLTGRCKFDYSNYPSDVATCKFVFENWTYRATSVNINVPWDEPYLNDDNNNNNPYWNLKNGNFQRNEKKFGANVYPSAEMTLFLTRKQPVVQYQLQWITSVIVVLLTLCMFWIPADIRQKLSLGCIVLIMLTIILVCLESTVKVPKLSARIVKPIHITMFAVTVAVIFQIMIINFRYIQEYEPPEFILNIFSGTISRLLLINSIQAEEKPIDKMNLYDNEEEIAPLQNLTKNENWQIIGQIADRILFIFYVFLLSALPKTI